MANRRGRVMIVTDVHHLNIATQDLALTVAFYTDILGLVDGPRPNFPSKGHWLYVGDRSTSGSVSTRSTSPSHD